MTYKLSAIQRFFMVGFVLVIKEVNCLTHRYNYGLQTNDDNVLVCYRFWFVNADRNVNISYNMFCSYIISALLQLDGCRHMFMLPSYCHVPLTFPSYGRDNVNLILNKVEHM